LETFPTKITIYIWIWKPSDLETLSAKIAAYMINDQSDMETLSAKIATYMINDQSDMETFPAKITT